MNCNNPDDHCCWVHNERCRYLEENVDGRRWSCRLRRELGSWEEVHKHRGYIRYVRNPIRKHVEFKDCGDWPPKGQTCAVCGEVGK